MHKCSSFGVMCDGVACVCIYVCANGTTTDHRLSGVRVDLNVADVVVVVVAAVLVIIVAVEPEQTFEEEDTQSADNNNNNKNIYAHQKAIARKMGEDG